MRAFYPSRWIAGIGVFLVWCCFSPSHLFGNEPPTISRITDQNTWFLCVPINVSFNVFDPDTPADKLMVTAFTTNTTVLGSTNITATGTGTNRTISLVPTNFGTAVINVTVSDGIAEASTSFSLRVAHSADFPGFLRFSDQAIDEDASLQLSLSVWNFSQQYCPEFRPTWSATSDNPVLLPMSNITITATSATNATAVLTPIPNQTGQAKVMIRVSDGWFLTGQEFNLTVNPVNDPPVISAIPDQIVPVGAGPIEIRFLVSDIDTPVENLTVAAVSSDQDLLANTNIVLRGSGTNRVISFPSPSTPCGTASVNVTVSDGLAATSTSFNVTVPPFGPPPLLWPIPDQVLTENTSRSINISASGGFDCAFPSYTFFAASDNAELFPASNLVLTRNATNKAILLLLPATNRIGRARITVRISDGQVAARQSFLAVVNPIVRAETPVLSGANVVFSFSASATGDLTLEHSPDLHVWTPIGTNRTAKSLLYAAPILGPEASGFFRAKLENPQ